METWQILLFFVALWVAASLLDWADKSPRMRRRLGLTPRDEAPPARPRRRRNYTYG